MHIYMLHHLFLGFLNSFVHNISRTGNKHNNKNHNLYRLYSYDMCTLIYCLFSIVLYF